MTQPKAPSPKLAHADLSPLLDIIDQGKLNDPQRDPLPVHSAHDLSTLALLIESGELTDAPENPGELCPASKARLREVAGPRPKNYWTTLIACSMSLGLVKRDGDQWTLTNRDAEIFGATHREAFSGFMAAWFSSPEWVRDALGNPDETEAPWSHIARDLLDWLNAFEENVWYRTDVLDSLAQSIADRYDVHSSAQNLSRRIAERVLLVMGACEIDEGSQHFRRMGGLCLPPPSPRLRQAIQQKTNTEEKPKIQKSRAELYSDLILKKLQRNASSWQGVRRDLARYREQRRDRESSEGCLRLLDRDGLIAADPKAPFKDCLFLARISTLVPNPSDTQPGQYTFRLNPETLQDQLDDGLSRQSLVSFFNDRGCALAPTDLETLLSTTNSEP